jgi:hypothetical protein
MIAPVVLREMAAHSPMDFKTPILTQVSTAYLLSSRESSRTEAIIDGAECLCSPQWGMIGVLLLIFVYLPESPCE